MSKFDVQRLPNSTFGGLVAAPGGAEAVTAAAEADAAALPGILDAHAGLLLIKGMQGISEAPELLLRLSRLFGTEVESYHETRMARQNVHTEIPEIFMVSNIPPADKLPPARPEPPLTEDGKLPTRFPHRRGWHTDQSYRRPPPDVSLFYCVIPAPKDQAQTLYANGIAAYAGLSDELKGTVEGLVGIHAKPGVGRGEFAVRAGETPQPLGPGDQPQRQPVVRVHPTTGVKSLYLCEAGQMDWIDGPFVGMEPGPDGAGGKLLYELMAHFTRPEFVYAHEWDAGDLVIYDNRTLIHAATWFDAEEHQRLMWRTTVSGNPGAAYAGEAKSWLAA
ncbi:MAG: TauD/TfdA family dioxygenase [Rickettsiales bacterium]